MSTWNELMMEFSKRNGKLRQDWVDKLSLIELKTLLVGLEKAFKLRTEGTWVYYVEELILNKIVKDRNDKLNELGI